jgi:hypothetical protein
MFVAYLLMLVKSFNKDVQLTKLKVAITHKLDMVTCTKNFGKLVVKTHENALATLEQMKFIITSSICAKHLEQKIKLQLKMLDWII